MRWSVIKPVKKIALVILFFCVCSIVFAEELANSGATDPESIAVLCPKGGISGIACNITNSFQNIAKLVTGISFIAGLGFAVASIFKFKAHKDNPTQITIGVPIAMLFIAVVLLFLTYFFQQLGVTVFGSGHSAGTWSGVSSI